MDKLEEWRYKLFDYIYEEFEGAPRGFCCMFSVEEIYEDIGISWPYIRSALSCVIKNLEECGIHIYDNYCDTITKGYFLAKKIKQCICKRPAAYGRRSFFLLDKLGEVWYTIDVLLYSD